MSNRDEIEEAINGERDRCSAILDLYRKSFEASSDSMMAHLWCRIRNQIASGTPVADADFGSQLGIEETDDSE